MQALFNLFVVGRNVTAAVDPLLESITTIDKAGTTSDTCSVVLNDAGGAIYMPSKGDPLALLLGWNVGDLALVFDGTVDEVRASGTRGGGRTLNISAKGFDTKGKAKEPLEFHKDDATLKEFLEDAAKRAGLKGVKIASALASIKREYWFAATESFVHLGHRLAEELGGTFKIAGDIAVLADMGSGLSVSGLALDGTIARWGEGGNLLHYDITPTIARPRFRQTRVRYYDRQSARYKEETVDVEIPGLPAGAQHTHRTNRYDADEAKSSGRANSKRSKREAGAGSVTIVGTTAPQPEGTITVVGCRPGVDGSYKIESVEHNLTRGAGWTTKVGLKEPQQGADGGATPGTDTRG